MNKKIPGILNVSVHSKTCRIDVAASPMYRPETYPVWLLWIISAKILVIRVAILVSTFVKEIGLQFSRWLLSGPVFFDKCNDTLPLWVRHFSLFISLIKAFDHHFTNWWPKDIIKFNWQIGVQFDCKCGLSCFQGTATSYFSPVNLMDLPTLLMASFSSGVSCWSTRGMMPIDSRLQNCFIRLLSSPSLLSGLCIR